MLIYDVSYMSYSITKNICSSYVCITRAHVMHVIDFFTLLFNLNLIFEFFFHTYLLSYNFGQLIFKIQKKNGE